MLYCLGVIVIQSIHGYEKTRQSNANEINSQLGK